MSIAPDPKLRRALDEALPDPNPRPGARARVRTALSGRLETAKRFRQTSGYFAAAAAAGLVVAAMAALQRKPAIPSGEGSQVIAATPSTLVLSSGAKVLVAAGSDVKVERDDERETSIRLGHGRVMAHVEKRAGRPFVVHGDDARVEVMGTTFAVEAKNASIVGVGVVTGRVKVSRAGESWVIAPGQSWPADAVPLVITEEELSWARGEGATSSEALPDEAPARAELPGVTGVPSTEPPPPKRESSPYAIAKQRESRGDLKGALSAYEAVAGSADNSAEDALFAQGRLQVKLGNPARALETFRSYRRRYPNGGYARAVDVHVLDLLVGQGNDEAVLGEANRFLETHWDDARAWRFRMARAGVKIKKGDCASALGDLAGVPEREALPLRERCAR